MSEKYCKPFVDTEFAVLDNFGYQKSEKVFQKNVLLFHIISLTLQHFLDTDPNLLQPDSNGKQTHVYL